MPSVEKPIETEKHVEGYRDLRDLIPALEAQGQLMRVTEKISPEPGVRGYLRAASAMENDGPAVLFNNIEGYSGKQLIVNTHGSWANLALMFGRAKKTPLKELFSDLSTRWDRYPAKVEWLRTPRVRRT